MEALEVNGRSSLRWGETVWQARKEYEFVFTYIVRNREHVLKAPIEIPVRESTKGLMCRLVASHDIPCYIEHELLLSLETFVQNKTAEFNKLIYSKMVSNLKQLSETSKQKLVSDWHNAYHDEHSRYQPISGMQEDCAFSEIYHSLIHSPALETLLQLEHSYSLAMKDLVKRRNGELAKLRLQHERDMELMVSNVGVSFTDGDVNELAARHLEEAQMQEIFWTSAISELQESQKREYKSWVFNVHEKTVASNSQLGEIPPSSVREERSNSIDSYQVVNFEAQEGVLEESFTIHLGHQMKTMHNVKLVCRDILDFCRCKAHLVGGTLVPHPQRLQTAMSLYSESLSALVLLVDDRLQSRLGVKKDFQDICSESTDFHFPDYDKQVCIIEHSMETRPARSRSSRAGSILLQGGASEVRSASRLQTGDCYITKHSNLSEVHAVFHLVSDESVQAGNLNSRHPIMIGVRNIMLAAARHSIVNLVVPLLLSHEMTENMTVQWCMKRAELVFKCVKGFMMESLSWDGHESRTLQFVVPTGISEGMFSALSAMLPSIFRVSTPLDLSKLSVP